VRIQSFGQSREFTIGIEDWGRSHFLTVETQMTQLRCELFVIGCWLIEKAVAAPDYSFAASNTSSPHFGTQPRRDRIKILDIEL
jgi:hypothetical protein